MDPALKILLLCLPALINLWAIWHAFQHRFSSMQQRLIWICVAVFLPVIGGLAYLLIGRKYAGEHL